MSHISIRQATIGDAETIHNLIHELAVYQKLEHELVAGVEEYRQQGFGENPAFECLLAEREENDTTEALGLVLFYPCFSTFSGRQGMHLEDIYVRESARGLGIASKLMARLAMLAIERNYVRIDLAVLDWNPARKVYAHLGFMSSKEWENQRIYGKALEKLAARHQK